MATGKTDKPARTGPSARPAASRPGGRFTGKPAVASRQGEAVKPVPGRSSREGGGRPAPKAGRKPQAARTRPAEDLDSLPCPEFGGLSQRQLLDLLGNGWWNADGPVSLRGDLGWAELSRVPIMSNARLLLDTLGEEGPIGAAADGTLPRMVVQRILDGFTTPETWLLESCRRRRNLTEREFPGIFQLRYLCQFAGLVACRKMVWNVTPLGRSLLEEDRAGELFLLLFNTLFRKFTLADMDRLPSLPQFQDSIPYVLFRMQEVPEGKRFALALVPDLVLLPAVVGQMELTSNPRETEAGVVYLRGLRPLEDFGLVKMFLPKTDDPTSWPTHITRTALFQRFICFRDRQPA